MAVREIRRYKNLPSVSVGKGEALPFVELFRVLVAVYDGKIEFPVQAGYQFPGCEVSMQSTEDPLRTSRDIILNKFQINACFTKFLFIIELHICPPIVLKSVVFN